MKKYTVLVLTDHDRHTKENSIYPIVAQMHNHPLTEYIDVASRSNESNHSFFHLMQQKELIASRVTSEFTFTQSGRYFKSQLQTVNVCNYDIILLRLPRPIDDNFFLWLESNAPKTVIINRPSGIIKTSNKAFLQRFKEICPPLKLCFSKDEIVSFAKLFPIVLKPLKEYGGKGILKIDGDRLDDGHTLHNPRLYLEKLNDTIEKEGYLAMRFLKNVKNGDKRILVVGGEVMACSLRLPAKDSWLCNVARGGESIATEINPEELKIVEKINPIMQKEGIFIFGIDTIENDDGLRMLSEINTLSIGGFLQSEHQTGLPIIKKTIDKIFEYVANEYIRRREVYQSV